MNDLLNLVEVQGAEELRLEPGQSPVMVLRGQLRVLDQPLLTSDQVAELFGSFATETHLNELRRCGDVRFTYVFRNSAHFGVTASMQHGKLSVKMKHLSR
ncbi:MAG TPA: hypothetical protein VNZ22_14870 [Bacillota bacterium]|nr:hypothetical protein [Bacillota bacterium]